MNEDISNIICFLSFHFIPPALEQTKLHIQPKLPHHPHDFLHTKKKNARKIKFFSLFLRSLIISDSFQWWRGDRRGIVCDGSVRVLRSVRLTFEEFAGLKGVFLSNLIFNCQKNRQSYCAPEPTWVTTVPPVELFVNWWLPKIVLKVTLEH